MLVAAASMFTAVQALNVSQAAARQKIFESQLAVCMQFGELTTRAVADAEKNAALFEGVLDDDSRAQLETALTASDELSQGLHRQYLQMTMVLPDDVSDAAFAALEKRTEIYNAQVEAFNADAVTPADLTKLAALASQEEDLLNTASAACRDHVAGEAGLG